MNDTAAPSSPASFSLDGQPVAFEPGQTIMQAAQAAGLYIPHLCHHASFHPVGSCKVCTVHVQGRSMASCTTAAQADLVVESNTPDIQQQRQRLVQMLFVEGNHHCPFCEKSGQCHLQSVAYHVGMQDTHFVHAYPLHEVDASHPDVMLDRSRCILCELCVRASREVDGKNVFALGGRGPHTRLLVNSPSGLLQDSALSVQDRAVSICPVGALLPKRRGFIIPIGQRQYDGVDISERPQDT